MTKSMTIKALALACLLALGWQAASAQTFWTETFSDQGASTTNWVSGGTNSGAVNWDWTDVVDAGAYVPGNFGAATAASGYMWFDSDTNGDFPYDVTLTGSGNAADCTGKTNVHLKFYTLFRIFNPGYVGEVGISTDGGANYTYHTVPEFAGLDGASAATDRFEGLVDLAIPEADGAASVIVQFRWIGQYDYYWKVDDLELYEYSTPSHDVTFRVNMALETVNPAGVYIAGSFNGATPEAMNNDGNGVYSITKNLIEGEVAQYIFLNGPAGLESVPAACGTPSGAGFDVRAYTVGTSDAVLPAVCFSACAPCVVPCDLNPNAIICDNFDAYVTNLKLGPQATWWTTWSGTEGGTEDGIVTTEQANTAPNSVKIVSTAATGGPQDVVLNLGNKTTGNYELKWKLYVPAGKHGYYNIQNVVPIGAGDWNLDVFFDDANSGHIQIGQGSTLATFSYPSGSWFEVKHVIDLDNNLITLYVNGNFVKKMPYPNNLGGIDFYGTDNVSQFYIDDVEYVQLAPVVYNVDECSAAVDLTQYLGQPAGVAQTTGLFDNTNATVSPTDPAVDCWSETAGADIVDGSMWYTFTGDGGRYSIQTVPCNATNYIGTAQDDPGDTQMAIYSGTDCTNLTLELCNDDLSTTGDPDWRAGVDIETVSGQNYYMLIDGFNFSGTVATGEFCIEITQVPSVGCADGAVGTFTLANGGTVCFGDNLTSILQPNNASFVIPNVGPVYGMAWCITAAPIPANTWPGDVAGVASTAFNSDVILVNLPNDGSGFAPGQYYLTAVVVGGGTLIDPTGLARVFNVDPTGGCYFVGPSQLLTLVPQLGDILAIGQVTNATTPPGNNGAITLAVEGGIAEFLGDPSLYLFNWSNGAITQNLTGLAGGTYTVTIGDPTGCVADYTATFTVGNMVGTSDPASVQTLTLTPNPTSSDAVMSLRLANAAEVRVDVVNSLGQIVRSYNAGKVQTLNQSINLGDMPEGTYFLKISVDNETAVRRLLIQR